MDRGSARTTPPPKTAGSIETMMLQTAASLANAAADFYAAAFALPFIRTGEAAVARFLTEAAGHHRAHARSFNAAAIRGGALPQTAGDPRYAKVVADAWPSMTSTAAVVSLALTLEDTAAQTFVKFAGLAGNGATRQLFGSAAPVDAQHRATLLVMQALLQHGANNLIGASPGPARLPVFVGSVGLPVAAYPAADASAVNEGIVR